MLDNATHTDHALRVAEELPDEAQRVLDGPSDVCEKSRALAALPPLEYEQLRKSSAKELGVRVDALDKEVARLRGDGATKNAAQGSELVFSEPEPWDYEVDGSSLLDSLVAVIRQHVVLNEHSAIVVTLWVVLTYLHDLTRVSPILAITSPEKRCGKTTLLGILTRLVCRPLPASNISNAAVFRTIEHCQPTLLIDEADSFLRDNEELRGVLNSGHTPQTAFVIRTVGEDYEPRRFSTWTPKALALIGSLPDTLEDRSLPVRLQRKLPGEKVASTLRGNGPDLTDTRRQLARWVEDNREAFAAAAAAVHIPEALYNRAADSWEPLLRIAELVGSGWPEAARAAAVAISGSDDVEESRNTLLLSDIERIFDETANPRLTPTELADALNELEERPWQSMRRGNGVSTDWVSKTLKKFGVASQQRRSGTRVARVFDREHFTPVFQRYLRQLPADKPSTCLQGPEINGLEDSKPSTDGNGVDASGTSNPVESQDCRHVDTFTEGSEAENEIVI